LLFALAIAGFFWLLGLAGLVRSGRPMAEIVRAPLGFPHAALPALGCVTMIFAAVEFCAARFRLPERLNRWNQKWDPRILPPVTRDRPIPRAGSIRGLIFEGGLGAWFLTGLHHPQLLWGRLPLTFAPVWQDSYLPIALLVAVSIARRLINLARPDWTWLPAVAVPLVAFYTWLAVRDTLRVNSAR
jgi:hypothetical protein